MNKVLLWLTGLSVLVFSGEINAETSADKAEKLVSQSQKPAQPTDLLSRSFLTQPQLEQLYQEMIEFIEKYDAEGIETRNFSKKTQWQAYKKLKQKAFFASKNWHDLKAAYDQFAAGFVNLHSHFSFNPSIKNNSTATAVGLAFTYPELSFFDVDTLQTIDEFNQKSGLEVFYEYEQNSCRFNSTIGCLNAFRSDFNRGKVLVNGKPVTDIKVADKTKPQKHDKNKAVGRRSDRRSAIDVSDYHDWRLLEKGHKVAVLEQNKLVLLVIKNFVYGKGTGGGFRCVEPAEKETMCADIQLIRKAFNNMDSSDKSLIINVQNNGGGKENTPFLAELSQAPFKDLAVQYKNTDLLTDDSMRNALFYGSDRAENWHQNLSSIDKDKSNQWLPVRADFCRADKSCQLEWIKPNSKRQFKTIYILTNDGCVSSCDDLVWRMNEYSDAVVVGLPQAADATYSRVSGTFYLDSNNQINMAFHADGMQAEYDGVELFSLTIPYSKTINGLGQIRQGRAAHTQFILPITKENFATHALDSVKQLAYLINNSEI